MVAKNHPVAHAKGYGPAPFVWQQDGALAHTVGATQKFLASEIKFWEKDFWLPNSPDLNPLDYSIWNHISSKACYKPDPNVGSLKRAVNRA